MCLRTGMGHKKKLNRAGLNLSITFSVCRISAHRAVWVILGIYCLLDYSFEPVSGAKVIDFTHF